LLRKCYYKKKMSMREGSNVSMKKIGKRLLAGCLMSILVLAQIRPEIAYAQEEMTDVALQAESAVQETEETEAGERLDILDVSGGEQTGSVDLPEVSGEEWAAEAALAPETTEDADKADRASGKCYVYVCGEVAEPGVYVLEPGDRIYEAVEMAGGMTADAGTCAVNLAESVYDGLMVYIPDSEEAAGMAGSMTSAGGSAVSAGGSVTSADSSVRNGEGTSGGTALSLEDGRLNLNTASLAELMTLSGIGQTKAQAVVNYRDAHGGFSSVEEIMNVDGIKEGLYNRIRDQIKVK
jgi:competence protein ComEA